MSNPTFAECEKTARETLAKAEATAKEQRANLAALAVIGAKYPDAKRITIRRPEVKRYSDSSVYYMYTSIDAWEADLDATEDLRIDPYQFGVEESRTTSMSFAKHVLYLDVETPEGNVRVYHSRPVDVVAGFGYYSNPYNGANLAGALASTFSRAEHLRDARAVEVQAAQAAEEANMKKDIERMQAAAAEKAQPVVIVGTVAVKQESAPTSISVSTTGVVFDDK